MPDPPQPEPTSRFPTVPATSTMPGWYPALLASVSDHITTGHRRAVAAANAELLAAYWSIDREILDRQHEEGYGTKVIDRLSADLKKRFPEARGYLPRNLKYMRAFAAAWPEREVVQRGVAQLPWRHHIALLGKLGSAEVRQGYAAAALEGGWSRAPLRNYNAPLGAAEWTTAITTSLPDELATSLPSIAEIEAELAPTGEDEPQRSTPRAGERLGATVIPRSL
jgi:hypothetical protein